MNYFDKTLTYRLMSLVVLAIIFSCSNLKNTKYDLMLDDDNIWVEQFDSTNTDSNRYNHNNNVFKVNTQFIYSFEHIKSDDTKWSFIYIDSIQDWKFVSLTSPNERIEKVYISVMEGLEPMNRFLPNYNQTILSYSYWTNKTMAQFGSHSGVIENENNVWMHPPRDKYFKILELNPFPYIKSPYKVGNSWEWSLQIGDNWSDERWKSWNGLITNKYNYKIVDRQMVETALGKLKCYIIEAEANSEIGTTKLISYFNKEYGFVKLHYQNIDGTQTNLDILKVIHF